MSDAATSAAIEAVRALVLAGVLEAPSDLLGGFSVAWMRRALLGRAEHQKLSAARLEAIMSRHGFKRIRKDSVVFELRGYVPPIRA